METQLAFHPNTTISGSNNTKPGILNLFKCKCPRCRQGDMFADTRHWHLKNTLKMNKECAVCKQPFNIEVGFYYGSSYVSYALSIAVSVATFLAWCLLIGISTDDNRVFYWLILNAALLLVLQPYLMRVARTGWLFLFVRYDKDWRINPPKPTERINEEQEGNW